MFPKIIIPKIKVGILLFSVYVNICLEPCFHNTAYSYPFMSNKLKYTFNLISLFEGFLKISRSRPE